MTAPAGVLGSATGAEPAGDWANALPPGRKAKAAARLPIRRRRAVMGRSRFGVTILMLPAVAGAQCFDIERRRKVAVAWAYGTVRPPVSKTLLERRLGTANHHGRTGCPEQSLDRPHGCSY